MYIWKRKYNPFKMGGNPHYNIKTEVEGYPAVKLGKGFEGIFIKGSGVYELKSGALVGDTVESVRADIGACGDISFMRSQVDKAAKELEAAKEVSNEEFFR